MTAQELEDSVQISVVVLLHFFLIAFLRAMRGQSFFQSVSPPLSVLDFICFPSSILSEILCRYVIPFKFRSFSFPFSQYVWISYPISYVIFSFLLAQTTVTLFFCVLIWPILSCTQFVNLVSPCIPVIHFKILDFSKIRSYSG